MKSLRANLVALALLASPAFAQEPAPAAAPVDEDAAFDDAVRQFGYVGGLAWQCSTGVAQAEIEGKALETYQGITRLFGSDQAFFFAASFGAGTMVAFEKTECEAHVASFSEQMAQSKKAE